MMQATIHGKTFEVAPEPADYWGWVAEGRYDHEWKVYDEHLSPEATFIDIGAWVGSHSLYASTIAKRVISVEPDPVAFAILVSNLKPNMIAIQRAVADSESITLGSGCLGASTTRANPSAGGGISAWSEDQTFRADCVTLRQLLQDVPEPLFVKMDIEGGEENVLQDISLFAERKPTLLIELHPWWWRDETRTTRDFDHLLELYRNSKRVDGNIWVLCN